MNIASLIASFRENGIEFCLENYTVRVCNTAVIAGKMLPALKTRKGEIID